MSEMTEQDREELQSLIEEHLSAAEFRHRTALSAPYRAAVATVERILARHAQPTALAADTEALAKALRDAGVEIGSVGGEEFRRVVAERLLASDWLAAHDAQVREEALAGIEAVVADIERAVRICNVGNTETIAKRLRAAITAARGDQS